MKRRSSLLLPLALLALLGCAPNRRAPTPASSSPAPRTPLALRPLAAPSGTCATSTNPRMTSDGVERDVLVFAPPSPRPGLPLVFVWHGLGATAGSMVPRMGLRELAASGAIVVVPQARPEAEIGWDPKDLALFDDLRACMSQAYDIDLARVATSGFSAGGLWSTYLLFHRGDALSSAVILSGGVLPPILPYSRPSWTIPVLLFDGGRKDIYRKGPVVVHFDMNTERLRDLLRRDGHLAVHCQHARGHSIPSARWSLMHRWALSHRYGAPSPLAAEEPPAGCTAE